MYSLILANIARHISLTDKEKTYFTALLKNIQVNKKDILLKEGQVCTKFYFVNSGAVRAYYVDRQDKETTIMFGVADWWITDMYSFLNQVPAIMYLDALENSEVLELSKESMDNLYIEVPKFERFFRIIIQNAYVREQVRVIQNLSMTAEERYEIFIKKYPHIVQRVTLKQIASYLGITPEFLSTIRARK
ncbi:MAG TPA: Crp/Fnr family transcriptional regulator [Cyclobacteriaceae bacterium]|nr:Crp/Fnr family transcriptional regulator [Cyclobacteriaceae bacterium]